MDSKALIGLSVTVGAVVAGTVYTAMQASAGGGLLAGSVGNYAKSDVARWAISAGAGVAAALLIPTINWFVSSFHGSAKSQLQLQRPNIEPKKIDLNSKGWETDVWFYDKSGQLSKIDHYGQGVKSEWIVTLASGQDEKGHDSVYDARGARLLDSSEKPLFLDVNKYKAESRLSRKV